MPLKLAAAAMCCGVLLTVAIVQRPAISAPQTIKRSLVQACPLKVRISNICDAISTKKANPVDKGQFLYERYMTEAACVTDADTDDIANAKISKMWSEAGDARTCQMPDFNIASGNFIKYALHVRAYDFIDLAIDRWKLDLNLIDRTDGRTTLDYVDEELKNAAPNYLSKIREYRNKLRRAGAKNCSELAASSPCRR